MLLGLHVGPFPSFVSNLEREKFLKYFGACKVEPIKKRTKIGSPHMIAIFSSTKECQTALFRIHQTEIFGRRLIAKYCDVSMNEARIEAHEKVVENKKEEDKLKMKRVLQKYESELTSISSTFNFDYPINPNLRYTYPPPSPKVISNIAHAIVAVPEFYTQVLHLMNKMNLPCPFGALTAEPSICKEARALSSVFNSVYASVEEKSQEAVNGVHSESESELESDEESRTQVICKPSLPMKRLKPCKQRINKKPKLDQLKQTFIKNSSNKDVHVAPSDINEVFNHKKELVTQKKLEMRVDGTSISENGISQKEDLTVTVGFGKIFPSSHAEEAESPVEPSHTEVKSSKYITAKDIQDNRVDKSDWPLLPVFKSYSAGEPSPKLYIKNLAKNVTEADLKHIFGKFINWAIEEEYSNFSIRHMKEGRMKGQAFITFPSKEFATRALEEVNGFILKDKPMVIVYGKVKATEKT